MMKPSLRFSLPILMVLVFSAAFSQQQAKPDSSLGLSRFASDQAEIWLPNDFHLVEPQVDLEEFRQFMTMIDPANSAYWNQPAHRGLMPIIELQVVRESSQKPFLDAVTVYALYHSIPPVLPPAPGDVAQGLSFNLPNSLRVFGYKELTLPAGEAAHIRIQSEIETFPVSSDVYSLTSAGSLWLITFSGDSETFDSEVRDFQASLETFRVVGSPSVADYYRHNSQIFLCCGSMLLILLIIVVAIKVRSSRGPIYEPGQH